MVGDENNPQRKRRKTETKKKQGQRGILVKELKFAKFTVL